MISSSASFSCYMIGYYTKYFPGTIFVNYAIVAFADCFSMLYITFLTSYMNRVKHVVKINLLIICVSSALYMCFVSQYPILVPFGIFVLRACTSSTLSYAYHMNQRLFPAEFRSLASGSMNFVSRLLAASALIVVEYTQNPIVFVFSVSIVVLFLSNGLIHEPKESQESQSFSQSWSNVDASDNYSR